MRTRTRVAIALAGLVVLLFAIGFVPNEPLRRSIESKMNASLTGYEASIGEARLAPFGLSLTLKDLVIRQTLHPDPPILVLPRLHASVHWKELLALKLVADFGIDRPKAYVNLQQLRAEVADAVPVNRKGWQQAVEAIYPLKINLLRVRDGALTYIDDDPAKPLELTNVNLRASNIRNIHSKDQTYPSPIQGSAVVFRTGRAELVGNADFLAEPFAGIRGRFRLAGIPLDNVKPVTNHWNVLVSGGVFSTHGEVEFAPKVRRLELPEVTIERLKIAYARRPPSRSQQGIAPAKAPAAPAPVPWKLKLERFRMTDSQLELVDDTRSPAYRLFVSDVQAEVDDLASEPPGRVANATAKGKFMGAGDLDVKASFRPGVQNADFDVKLAVTGTPMPKLNDLFRAYGKFDVYAGIFELYSEIGVHDRYMRGYVKPIFKSVEIYDARQDADKSIFKKVYEGAVDVASKIFKNHERDQVATNVDVAGPLGNAGTSVWDALGGVLENAFIQAILPGFDRQVGTEKKAETK